MLYRDNGEADHLEVLQHGEVDYYLKPMPEEMAKYVKSLRAGKKTVAIVGRSETSCSWAPFDDPEVEIWVMNEMHWLPWLTRVDRWFQIHERWDFTKDHIAEHWEWLQEEHEHPIYMQKVFDDIPACVEYPLYEIRKKLFNNIFRGEFKVDKFFTSTMDYMLALILYEEEFERIEIYGIELSYEGEWSYQREGLAYWLGRADERGIEIWLPENNTLLDAPLYGYEVTRDARGQMVLPGEGDGEP
jgi:hypothetical protein